MSRTLTIALLASAAGAFPLPATAQDGDVVQLRRQLAEAQTRLDAQERRLQVLEQRLTISAPADTAAIASAPADATPSALPPRPGTVIAAAPTATPPVLERVGEVPVSFDNMPNLAVLGDNGSVITRRGQLTGEIGFDYARADRSRALFRGIEPVESVLVGTFDINESRQDVLSTSGSLRYGLSSKLEFGVRVPFVYRNDTSILAPIPGSTNNDAARTIDSSATGAGLGDIELSLRYQLTPARTGRAFLIGNVQAIVPTGSNPFDVPRSEGRALKAATGAGFWGLAPSVTAILPTDPAVLFATLGYTHNFGADVDTEISPVRLTHVKPGDSVSGSAGIGVTLNQRTSFNLGYAHTWAFGTRTESVLLDPPANDDGRRSQTARDLQIGRFLFGVTYRVTDRTSVNWSVEVGATDDATDLRTVLRIPFVLLTGR